MNIDEAIKVARVECKDLYAKAYLESIPEAIELGAEMGVGARHSFSVQLLYAYSNMQYWRGQNAREVKVVIKEYLKKQGLMK
jgi:hypothetical protein